MRRYGRIWIMPPRIGYRQTEAHKAARKAAMGPHGTTWLGDQACQKMGRIRAERAFPGARPCEKCGAIRAERHHNDGNTLNNDLTNIAFLCRHCHMEADGRLKTMKRVRAAVRLPGGAKRLSVEQVRDAASLRSSGWSQSRIAARFGVQQSTISRILAGKRVGYADAIGGQQ